MNPQNAFYADALEERENRWLEVRRASPDKRAELLRPKPEAETPREPSPFCNEPPPAPNGRPKHIAGVALSGGGIRSATFCLGVLQALAGNKRLSKVDYLSTVSGGGYIGAFLGAWISRRRFSTKGDPQSEQFDGIENVEARLPNLEAQEIRFLRENGRFLAPNGGGDAWGAAVAHARNWLAMLVVIGTLLLAVFMLGESVKLLLLKLPPTLAAIFHPSTFFYGKFTIYLSPYWGLTRCLLVFGALPLAVSYWFAFPVTRGPAPAFYILPIFWSYLVIAFLAGRWQPDFIRNDPWTWLIAVTATIEWCLWVDFRQRLRQRHASGRVQPDREWTGYVGLVICALAVMALLFVILVQKRGWGISPFIQNWPTRSVWFLIALATWHGTREVLLKLAGRAAQGESSGKDEPLLYEGDFAAARSALTAGLATMLAITATVVVYALVDTIVPTIARELGEIFRWLWTLASPVALVALGQSFLPKLLAGDKKGAGSSSLLLKVALWVGASALLFVAVTGVGIAASLWTDHLIGPGEARVGVTIFHQFVLSAWAVVTLVAAALIGVSILLGRRLEFVNASSHHQLYSARLTRAYLGASNPERHGRTSYANIKGTEQTNWQVSETVTGDQLEYGEYKPQARGGPLHLINVTVNETVSGFSNVEQRDRKGFSLAIGPAGLSVRRNDHGIFHGVDPFHSPREAVVVPAPDPDGSAARARFHAFGVQSRRKYFIAGERRPQADALPVAVEMPPVGAWVGMSGAAFTTGLGARTNVATSLLLGFFNVRLGYWWKSGVIPERRHDVARRNIPQKFVQYLARLLPAQVAFFDELLARFHGMARMHWYVSDGGHFENTACYELVRRRVPFIICCDCGCDPDYTFQDVGNLVRKARIDFGARIRFLNRDQLTNVLSPEARKIIGPLSELRANSNVRAGQNLSTKHAALARITYPNQNGEYTQDSARSILLLIKPTLTTNISRDVLQYGVDHQPFPQQTTMDQFFDEAQWESYRQLGWEIGQALFSLPDLQPASDDGWRPRGNQPPPSPPQPPTQPGPPPDVMEDLLRIVFRYCEQHGDYEESESTSK